MCSPAELRPQVRVIFYTFKCLELLCTLTQPSEGYVANTPQLEGYFIFLKGYKSRKLAQIYKYFFIIMLMKINLDKLKFSIFVLFLIFIFVLSIILNSKGSLVVWYDYLKQVHIGIFLPLVYLSLYIVSAFFPLPLLSILGASLFPAYEAFILSLIGNVFFFTLTFYMARWFGRKYVLGYEEKHPRIKKLNTNFNNNSFLYIFLFRLIFIIPRQAINTLAGFSKMKFSEYLFASILGVTPVVLVSILLVKSYQMNKIYLIVVSLFLLILFIALPYFLMKDLREYFRKNKLRT